MQGRVCVVTGASSGIGRETALALTRRGARVVLACRSRERTEPVLEAIRKESGPDRVAFVQLDLGSFASVRRAAEELLAAEPRIDVLVNNAGVAGIRGTTEDGFELAFGVNHLGHFLWTVLLEDCLVASAPARVVIVASDAHYGARGIDYDAVQTRTRSRMAWPEYCVSKLANVMFSMELGRRLGGTGVTTCALHPGVVGSGLWRPVPWPIRPLMKLFMISNEAGARTSVWCASSPALAEETGGYYDACAPKSPSRVALDEVAALELWNRSADFCGIEA